MCTCACVWRTSGDLPLLGLRQGQLALYFPDISLLHPPESFLAAALSFYIAPAFLPGLARLRGGCLFLQLKEGRPWEPEHSKLPRSKMLQHS